MQAVIKDPSPGVFGKFASDWIRAMVSAVLGSAEEAAQQGIHYLLLDVCFTCLTWHSLFPALYKDTGAVLTAQTQVAANALMDFLVRLLLCGCLPHLPCLAQPISALCMDTGAVLTPQVKAVRSALMAFLARACLYSCAACFAYLLLHLHKHKHKMNTSGCSSHLFRSTYHVRAACFGQ